METSNKRHGDCWNEKKKTNTKNEIWPSDQWEKGQFNLITPITFMVGNCCSLLNNKQHEVSEDPWSTATYTKGNTPVNVKKVTSKSMCSKNMLKKRRSIWWKEKHKSTQNIHDLSIWFLSEVSWQDFNVSGHKQLKAVQRQKWSYSWYL